MIHDFDQYPDEAVLQADICIVGSGAAGMTIANEFFNTPWKVVVLEGGGRKEEMLSQDLYRSEVIGLPHTGVHEGRFRIFGGSTTAWGGQLLPLTEEDFLAKEWVPHSGWPICLDDLITYYRRAERIMGVSGPPYDEQRWLKFGKTPPPLDSSTFRYRFSQWAPIGRRNVATLFEGDLKRSTNVDLLIHANAVNIVTNEASSYVEQVIIKSLSGKTGSVKARHYIICCGGIESARLLLASNSVEPNGIGNGHDLVGRYFQDHISLDAGEVIPPTRQSLQALFDPYFDRSVMYTPKIEMTSREQRRCRVLNVIGHLKFEVPEDSGFYEIKKMLLNLQARRNPIPSASACRHVAKDSQDFVRLIYGRTIRKRRPSMSRGHIRLIIDSEQAPQPESRVSLSEQIDALGMPRAAVTWRLSELDYKTLSSFAYSLQEQWERLGLGTIALDAVRHLEAKKWHSSMRDIYHHMGTTRMSNSPGYGVVDKQCRMHTVFNLYIGSSSVFPTSGNSNPTLTIMALCLRIADCIKREPN